MLTAIIYTSWLFWQDLINLVHRFDGHNLTPNVLVHSKPLRQDGITKLNNFISEQLADQIRTEAEELIGRHPISTELPNGARINHRNQGKEGASDLGMIDVFSAAKSIPLIESIDQSHITDLINSATGQQVIPVGSNIYSNESITNTRGYHIDNVHPVYYKAFIYLTNVPDTSYGPYSFVKKSHQFNISTYYNLIRNVFSKKNKATDMPAFDQKNILHCLGNKGDLILSNQNAIHRGLPQEIGKKRMVLVLSYLVKSKLSYVNKSAVQRVKQNAAKMT